METCYELLPFLREMKKNKYIVLVKGNECWLYLDNPADSVWIGIDEQTPERARKEIGSQKIMITVFWGADRIWHIHALPHEKSMTSVTFINNILTQLFGKMHQGIEHLDQVYELLNKPWIDRNRSRRTIQAQCRLRLVQKIFFNRLLIPHHLFRNPILHQHNFILIFKTYHLGED
ncbi:MAG: hypothetical protein EZS28_006915 [Streblomastix strix]|uniref:Uncharacterized protein n=1 Tax=Streblomastix strix TaxID=222440 RepID=A0A5J4WRL5_9EUKA|nr:MAG: hypothetical protein EZS28_006915 [Streblomastix strix]